MDPGRPTTLSPARRSKRSHRRTLAAKVGGGRRLVAGLTRLLATGLLLSVHATGAAAAAGPISHRGAAILPGATVAPTGSERDPALVVTSLRTGGEAARSGIRVGDRVLVVDGKAVRRPGDLSRALAASGNPILHLRLRRGTQAVAVALRRHDMGTGHGASHIGRGR